MMTGEKIFLRPFCKADLESFVEKVNTLEAKGEFLPLNFANLTEVQKKFDENGFLNEDSGRFMIIEKESKRPLGYVLYFKAAHYMSCYEIGYCIYSNKDRGRGICSEATNLLTNWLFLTKEMNRLQICMDTKNEGSRRVAEKCGYQHEGVLRGSVYSRGKYNDLHILSMTREDFNKNQEVKK